MDVNERIRQQINIQPVVLFMKGTRDFPQCGFSARAVQILDHFGAEYATFNILEDPEMREGLKQYSNWPTFPQLYIAGSLVGGCDIMMELASSGEMDALLRQIEAQSDH